MRLSHCTHDVVFHVAANMRAADKEEIYAQRSDERANPYSLTHDVMLFRNFAWVAWHGEQPVAVGGAGEAHPGVFNMFLFGTDDLAKIGLAGTRFTKRFVIPMLFDPKYIGARRLQCDSHENHVDAHVWLKLLGFQREAALEQWGRDGATYYRYALCRSPRVDKPDKPC